MSKKASTYLIPSIVLLVFIGSVVFFYFSILNATSGNFVYPLDDTYIHLSIAKHWIVSGFPSINTGEFAFLTSSPLWTVLIAVFAFLEVHSEMLPFYISLFSAVILIIYLFYLFLPKFKNNVLLLFFILLIVFSASLPLLVIMGMEHLLHISLLLVLFVNAGKFFRKDNNSKLFGLYVLVALLPLVRYESFFAVGAIVLLLLLKKQFMRASVVLIIAILPVILVGLYSLAHGGTFLPTSLLLKGEFVNVHSLKGVIKTIVLYPVKKLVGIPALLLIFVTAVILLFNNRKKLLINDRAVPLFVFVITLIVHLLFAKTGWLFRYEAYLIVTGMVVIVLYLLEPAKENSKNYSMLVAALLVAISLALLFRAYDSNSKIKPAAVNIYEQQWQMADFFKKYYSGYNIAINDIGLIGYRANVNICDLWGLASNEIAALKIKGQLNKETINIVLDKKNVKIAAFYISWFYGDKKFYTKWFKAGTWEIKNNIVCGDNKVTFFAKDSTHFVNLVKNLIDYSGSLPETVIWKINSRR